MTSGIRRFASSALFFSLMVFATHASAAALQDRDAQENQDQEEEQEGPKSYSDVITAEAETDEGVFDVHWVDETLYFEIPDSLLGRDMLLVSRIGKVPVGFPGFSPAGVKTGEQVLRWERQADKILLRTISYSNVADDTLAISISVEANNFGPIIAAFDVEVDGALVEVEPHRKADARLECGADVGLSAG